MHDASVGWQPPPDAIFRAPHTSPESGESGWCHGDFGPWNINDIAYALRWFAPARDDEMARTWHHFPTVSDRAERVRSFLDAYGGLPPFDVAEAVVIRMEATMAMELSLAEAGVEPQRTWVAEGSQAGRREKCSGCVTTPIY